MAQITKITFIKLLELVLVCVLIGLHYHSMAGPEFHSLLFAGTFVGYLIILIGLFAGGFMGTPVNRRVDLFFSLVGLALFVVSGIIILCSNNYGTSLHDKLTAKGILSVIEGVLFLIDAILTFRGET